MHRKYTMQQDFYKAKLVESGIEVMIPDEKSMEFVNNVIYNELCVGKIRQESKEEHLKIIDTMAREGAQGVILGCTEIGLLVNQNDTKLPVFDTTKIHATKAAQMSIQ